MPLRIFVHVVGFTDVERHALNSIFRLSEERETRYSLWLPDAPEPAKLAFVDGHSAAAREWLARIPEGHVGQLFWVGQVAPGHAAKVFKRPLNWPDIVSAMDDLLAPLVPLDFDLDLADAEAPSGARRALVVDADRDAQLYFRAKLASADVYATDEAASAGHALTMLAERRYDVLIIDAGLPDDGMDVWQLLAHVNQLTPPVPLVLLIAPGRALPLRIKAWFAGAQAVLSRPPHPGELLALLQKK